jgi:leucine-rich repeat transmembrane neuronal protein 1/2
VEFTADSLRLDILELARTGNKLLSVAGRPDWMCQAVEVADPITFTTPDTVLVSHAFFFFLISATYFYVYLFLFSSYQVP